jgi:hypothetical protein
MESPCPQSRSRGAAAPVPTGRPTSVVRRAARAPAHSLAPGSGSIRLSGGAVDQPPYGGGDSPEVWRDLSSRAYQPCVPSAALEFPKASTARSSARRSRHCSLARRHLAGHQTRAQVQQHTILLVDESGVYPVPSVVRTDAPIGQTPIWREWRTREHLSASSAISPEGKRYFHGQDGAINSADVVAFLEHLRREVPGRMVVIWDGAPMHRRHVMKEFLATGAAQRLHRERLPAYAPELNPDEGIGPQLKGVEWRHRCGFDLRHRWNDLRTAVKRVRRKPRMRNGCFTGAGL